MSFADEFVDIRHLPALAQSSRYAPVADQLEVEVLACWMRIEERRVPFLFCNRLLDSAPSLREGRTIIFGNSSSALAAREIGSMLPAFHHHHINQRQMPISSM